eukprot:jgi/Mesen1/8246/ME000444S07395
MASAVFGAPSIMLGAGIWDIKEHKNGRSGAEAAYFVTSNRHRRLCWSGGELLASSHCLIGAKAAKVREQSRRLCGAAAAFKDGQTMDVAVTGATGFVGSRLVQRLLQDGGNVRVLTRDVPRARNALPGHARMSFSAPAEWDAAVRGCSAVVNLAGAPISQRWSSQVKATIKTSRLEATRRVVDAINAAPPELRPGVLLSSSAVGFYGTSETGSFDEKSPSGRDYLAEVCREWEAAAGKKGTGVRLVLLRSGIVLDRDGGALAKMLPIFKLFAGGPLGSGQQWFSWVHRDDLVSLIVEALRNPSYSGVVNGTAPNPVRMAELCSQLGAALGRPSWLPVPSTALQLVLGEGATVVLEGQRVLPSRAQELGFSFKYPNIEDALSAILAA